MKWRSPLCARCPQNHHPCPVLPSCTRWAAQAAPGSSGQLDPVGMAGGSCNPEPWDRSRLPSQFCSLWPVLVPHWSPGGCARHPEAPAQPRLAHPACQEPGQQHQPGQLAPAGIQGKPSTAPSRSVPGGWRSLLREGLRLGIIPTPSCVSVPHLHLKKTTPNREKRLGKAGIYSLQLCFPHASPQNFPGALLHCPLLCPSVPVL